MKRINISALVVITLVMVPWMSTVGRAQGRGHASPPPHAAGPGSPHGNPGAHPSTPPSNVAAHISAHPQLASRVQALLPAGMTLDSAASGFKNQGQFIAALHVSKNLGLSFPDVKTQMVYQHKSLGQAIQTLRPAANPKAEATKGQNQANEDLKTS